MSVQEVLASLDGFPPQPSVPALAPDLVPTLHSALHTLVEAHDTPAARQSVLAVALQHPDASWEPLALRWARDEGADNGVGALVARCLADGVFDGARWIALGDDPTPRGQDVLVQWAREHFEHFLDLCVAHCASPSSRYPSFKLVLSTLMTETEDLSSSPNSLMARFAAHAAMDTLIRSLMLDTANRLFALALRLAVSVIPFAPGRLTLRIPLLMAVLGRAVCWRDRPFVDNDDVDAGGAGSTNSAASTSAAPPPSSASHASSSGYTRTPRPAPALGWAVATSAAEDAAGVARAAPPDYLQPARIVRALLVALYGGWPSNVIAFVRDPAAYLDGKAVDAHASYAAAGWADVFPPAVVAARAVPLLREFQLHPSIIARNSNAELADDKRWTDAAEFASLGHLLRGDQAVEKADIYDFMRGIADDGGVERVVEAGSEEPAEGGQVDDGGQDALVRKLKEENELLRLEAKHTDRVRRQYLYHIGRLHRNSLRFNSDEAEIHTFANRLKEQQKTISTLNAELSQQRADASQAQQKHVKWQQELREKVAGFREDRKHWQRSAEEIRGELAAARATVQRQMDELAVVKNERFQLQNQLLEVSPKVQHIEDYEVRIRQLTEMQRLWDDDVRKLRAAEQDSSQWRARVFQLDQLVRSLTKDRDAQTQLLLQLEQARAAAPTPPPETGLGDDASSTLEVGRRDSTAGVVSTAGAAAHDFSFYIHVAENAKKRVDRLERENLELQVELERLRRAALGTDDSGAGTANTLM